MRSELVSRLVFLPVALGFACFGGALMNPPIASVIVLDEDGEPIEGANTGPVYWGTMPYRESNEKGRLPIRKGTSAVYKTGYHYFKLDIEPGDWKKEITMIRLPEGQPESPRTPYPFLAPLPPGETPQ